MPPRAVLPGPRSKVQKVAATLNRKVLPFRRDISGSEEAPTAQSHLETAISAIEREIDKSTDQPLSLTLARVVERICSLTNADGAAIALRDERGVVCRASQGDAPDVGSVLEPGSGLTGQCFEAAQVVVCDDAEKDSRVQLSIARSLRLRSALAVPIQTPGSVLGVVELLSSRPSTFDMTHVAALERVAGALGHLLAPAPPQLEEHAKFPDWLPKRKAIWILISVLLLALLLLLFGALRRGSTHSSAPAAPLIRPSLASGEGMAGADVNAGKSAALRSQDSDRHLPVAASAPPSAPPSVAVSPKPLKNDISGAQPTLPGLGDKGTRQTQQIQTGLEPAPPPAPAEVAKAAPLPEATTTIPVAVISPSIPQSRVVLEHTINAHAGWVTAVAFTADGRRLASANWDKAVMFWDVSTGQDLGRVGSPSNEAEALASSRDGRWLAGENSANTVILWDAATGRELRRFPGHKSADRAGHNWVYSITFSPDGRWLASAVDDRTVRIWEVATGRALRDLRGHRRSVIYVAFSPDGGRLATGGDSKSIQIWDVATGQLLRTLSGHKKDVCAVAFSPNGRWLASASRDNSVKLWNLVSGQEARTLTGHHDAVTSLAFSPDGRWLASGSWDKTIKIWDMETGRELHTLAGHTHHIYTVAFDSRGRWLASGSEDGTIKLWQVRPAPEQGQ